VEKVSNTMTTDTANEPALLHSGPYFNVVRLDDGRYRVQFVRPGVTPRTSYTGLADAVVKQAQRAGNLPIHTSDADVRRICHDKMVELI
jgi:hypothetical protein